MTLLERCPAATHVHVAVPCYGDPTPWTALSITSGCAALGLAGIKWSLSFQPGLAYLDLTRDMLATIFWRQTAATDLLFVDSDVAFPPENMVRIAQATRPLIGGVYRAKKDEIAFPVQFNADHLWTDTEGNINDIYYLPTGFLRINRGVFAAMIESAGGEDNLEYETDDGKKWLNFFNCGVREHKGKRTYIGEDTDFCWRWQALGGNVSLMPDLTFDHYGRKAWSGNWAEWMRNQNREHELEIAAK